MPHFLSHRLKGLVQSDIRRMTRECQRVGGINLGQGICDLPTPPLVRDSAIKAIKEEKSTYSFPEGIAELRTAIADKLKQSNNITVDSINDIVVTIGTSGAFAATVTALLNPGDGVLLFEPYYGYHLNTLIFAGMKPHFLELVPPHFSIDEEVLREAIKPETRAVVVCTPSNPSGKMFTRKELEIIAKIANERDLLVITDEIYEYFRYDGKEHISPAAIRDLKERTVTIMGLSKTFSITGWRTGYAVAPPEMARGITLVNDLHSVCAPTPLQYGVAAGFNAPPEFYETLRKDYQRKRDAICEALDAVGMSPIIPEGSYYVLADVSKLGFQKSLDAAMEFLEHTKVASVPGTSFYRSETGEKLLRFCFAKDDNMLSEACARIRTFAHRKVKSETKR